MLRRLTPCLAALAILTIAVTAFAGNDNVQQMLQANGCTGCHAASSKVIGPAWGWVAYRYKGQKNAAQDVANFIINGGIGYWKPWTQGIPMPSHHGLSKAQAEKIAQWILAQPPIKPPKP